MKRHVIATLSLAVVPGLAAAFTSGSTGADGAFNPTVNVEVQLPPSGIFNYTTVNIPAGVTVKFKKNAANTPVTMLATGDVTIAGTIDISGTAAAAAGAAGDGNQGDDGQPGKGGPGGFDGGRGGSAGSQAGNPVTTLVNLAGAGLGPGGGPGGATFIGAAPNQIPCYGYGAFQFSGAGGGYATAALDPYGYTCSTNWSYVRRGGASYGSTLLLPLVGGSGGGGGGGGPAFEGGGGGGGGGALLIASSGTVNVTGSVLANGGAGGAIAGDGVGARGGGGSGGAIRIMATTLAGNGTISAQGGTQGTYGTGITTSIFDGSNGAPGRIRLEAETITRTAASTPTASSDQPGSVFIAGLPTLKITKVAGVTVPANPTGAGDVTLPATTANPVVVEFQTTNVPVGNTVQLTVTPAQGAPAQFVSPALTGSTASAAASVSATLPVGPSVLQAQTTYTIVASLGDALSRYANNERVERITLTATLGGESIATLVTVSGKQFVVPAALLAAVGA